MRLKLKSGIIYENVKTLKFEYRPRKKIFANKEVFVLVDILDKENGESLQLYWTPENIESIEE